MSVSEETKKTVRSLKYRTQELDSKLQVDSPDMEDVKTRITEIKALASKLD
jgi:hypothetical protein